MSLSQPTSRAAETLVEIDHLSFAYKGRGGETPALTDFSLTLKAGEFLCLLGPSGCGKSTLLRVLSRLETVDDPTSVRWAGELPRVGMIFQRPSVLPWLTVEANVMYGIAPDVSSDERVARARKWIDRMGLSSYAQRRGYELSGGMGQRVAIARALAAEADLLLMDEPFAAVDEPTRLVLQRDLMEAWAAAHPTIVFVTHSIQESVLLADRVALLTARPASIRTIVEPPFPRPRGTFELQKAPEYASLTESLWSDLQEEMLVQRDVA